MGTYLSTPVTEKCEESGESPECPDVPCSWGVVDMQGWRKSMEDAHVAVTDIPLPQSYEGSECKSDAKVFGVFDGHGGAEVARFCSLYLVSVLTQQESWKAGVPVADEQRSSDPSESSVGLALRNAFHSLDRMINDPMRRDEIINLRNSKPLPGERRDAVSIPTETSVGVHAKETNSSNHSTSETAADGKAETGSAQGPSAAKPTIVHNGRLICNLPDHPIHAGATAIVAVLTGRILTVANAGDSRAVLCRAGGKTEALSFDHKPQQQVESSRITKAGGFVNQFGRVNGNLNLSRSIGDLKYKQVPGISPAEQIITSEPDILQVVLHAEDEFIILGCDGIWDCLSNENAVQFVRDRIDTKSPTEIGVEMLDEIISDDPRVTQGIGGDNMTVLIVDLRPSMRTGRLCPDTERGTKNEEKR